MIKETLVSNMCDRVRAWSFLKKPTSSTAAIRAPACLKVTPVDQAVALASATAYLRRVNHTLSIGTVGEMEERHVDVGHHSS